MLAYIANTIRLEFLWKKVLKLNLCILHTHCLTGVQELLEIWLWNAAVPVFYNAKQEVSDFYANIEASSVKGADSVEVSSTSEYIEEEDNNTTINQVLAKNSHFRKVRWTKYQIFI